MLSQEGRDLAATQLLISHLCHELVSPIGAINNGVELIEEIGNPGIEKDAFSLIGQSGRLAASRLRLFRMAYGSGGTAGDFRLGEARQVLADHLVNDARTVLDWPTPSPDHEFAPGGVQVLLNLAVQAILCMPRGGTVTVSVLPRTGATVPVVIGALGQGARLNPNVGDALAGRADRLDHASVHAYFCSRLLDRLNRTVRLAIRPDMIEFSLDLPVAN